VVLDPFAGTGSALVAALGLGRRALGCELNEGFAHFGQRRVRGARWGTGRMPDRSTAALDRSRLVIAATACLPGPRGLPPLGERQDVQPVPGAACRRPFAHPK
jgi:hypothetical protein